MKMEEMLQCQTKYSWRIPAHHLKRFFFLHLNGNLSQDLMAFAGPDPIPHRMNGAEQDLLAANLMGVCAKIE